MERFKSLDAVTRDQLLEAEARADDANRPDDRAGIDEDLVGGALLLATPERVFDLLVPVLIIAAVVVLALGDQVKRRVADRMAKAAPSTVPQTPLPNVTYAVGGVVIRAGGQAIGAIGVSGAPGGNLDEACAREAMAKIQDRIK